MTNRCPGWCKSHGRSDDGLVLHQRHLLDDRAGSVLLEVSEGQPAGAYVLVNGDSSEAMRQLGAAMLLAAELLERG